MSIAKDAVRWALGHRLAKVLPGKRKAMLHAWSSDPQYPKTLQVEPTRRCNLRCVMCALTQFYYKDRVDDMSLDLFKTIVSQMPPQLETVTLQGTGEPLLNEHLIEMVEFARSCGFRTYFNSNMLKMTDAIAERLVAAGHGEIMVSVETTHPERYADIRRNGTIEDFLAGLERLQRAKQKAGTEYPEVSACCILMKHTLDDVPELVRTLKAYGCRRVHFADLCTYPECECALPMADGTDMRELALPASMSEDAIRAKLDEFRALADDDMTITVPGDFGDLKIEKPHDGAVLTCAELWDIPFVKPDGVMATCCWAPQFEMGDFKTQRFEEIWFGDAYHDMRAKHLSNRHPEHCRNCQQLMYVVAPRSRLLGPPKPGMRKRDEVFLRRNGG